MFHNRLTVTRLAVFTLTGLLILIVSSSVQAKQQGKAMKNLLSETADGD